MTIKDEICPTVKVDARLLDDGTLWIKTDKLDKVGRVLVEHGTRCKQFYQDAPEPCEDAVSRKAVQYLLAHFVDEDKYIDACDGLKHLPPVTPKQRTGKWILDRSGAYCCSKCMEPCASYVMMKPRDKFCKMCGSRNEVTE